jgi:hypothetical protein
MGSIGRQAKAVVRRARNEPATAPCSIDAVGRAFDAMQSGVNARGVIVT